MPLLLLIGVLLVVYGFSILKNHTGAGIVMVILGAAIMNFIASVD